MLQVFYNLFVFYLGVYDNEVANDWMTSDREVASTLDQFVTSWHIDDGNFNLRLYQLTFENDEYRYNKK